MNIRHANSGDSHLLSTLCLDVQRLHADHHPDIFKMPVHEDFAKAFFDELLADETTRIFIAEIEQEALGYVVCKLTERQENSFAYTMRFLLIDQISVLPKARGQGVGAALIHRAEELAKELGMQRIQLDSWDFNVGAHAFFERLGFRKFNFRFWRVL